MDARRLNERLTRRELLALVGGVAASVAAACGGGSNGKATRTPTRGTSTPAATGAATAAATGTPAPSTLSCVVSPEMTEGPYFVDEMLNRADIRSDPDTGTVSEGVPLRLAITVVDVDGETCTPLAGALVDVWHCDAAGLYSDVAQNNTVGRKFLRGYQLTDAEGRVEFTTVYPGWYSGRAVHIHVKVRMDPESDQGYEFTSQLFFDESVTNEVYAQAPYSSRGAPDTSNAADGIFGSGGNEMMLALSREGEGYVGSASIGVQV